MKTFNIDVMRANGMSWDEIAAAMSSAMTEAKAKEKDQKEKKRVLAEEIAEKMTQLLELELGHSLADRADFTQLNKELIDALLSDVRTMVSLMPNDTFMSKTDKKQAEISDLLEKLGI